MESSREKAVGAENASATPRNQSECTTKDRTKIGREDPPENTRTGCNGSGPELDEGPKSQALERRSRGGGVFQGKKANEIDWTVNIKIDRTGLKKANRTVPRKKKSSLYRGGTAVDVHPSSSEQITNRRTSVRSYEENSQKKDDEEKRKGRAVNQGLVYGGSILREADWGLPGDKRDRRPENSKTWGVKKGGGPSFRNHGP